MARVVLLQEKQAFRTSIFADVSKEISFAVHGTINVLLTCLHHWLDAYVKSSGW